MQTFLPYADFARSAAALDQKRLGKQRVETLQIMKALLTGQGWVNHPATLMWSGYEIALLDYQLAICDEWAAVRGYKDTCADKTTALLRQHDTEGEVDHYLETADYVSPPWLGLPAFHRSHQSNLLRKDPAHYGPLFPGVPDTLEYVWPTKEEFE